MLTLGLMEGIFSFTAIALILLGGANANIPLHRILAPPALGLLAIVAYAVYDTGAVTTTGQLLGLLTGAFLGFLLPLAVLQWTWAENKRMDARPAPVAEPRVEQVQATVHHVPTRRERREERHHRREERRAHRHAA